MRVLVTGGRGQLGRGLGRRGPAHGIEVMAPGRESLDVTEPATIERALDALQPAAVIAAAAFTDVDRAEREPERAFAVNAVGAASVAWACAARSIPLVHVSTDYVFDGTARTPYREDAAVAPLGVYGASKAAGERAVLELGGTVVRTSWLFGEGGPSFVHAIARRAVEPEELRVVRDQEGCPTWVDHLADALCALVRRGPPTAIIHVCGDEPVTRDAFARAILDELRRHGPLPCARIVPIATSELPAAARRPAYSVLDTTRARDLGLPIGSWRDGLPALLAPLASLAPVALERGARR